MQKTLHMRYADFYLIPSCKKVETICKKKLSFAPELLFLINNSLIFGLIQIQLADCSLQEFDQHEHGIESDCWTASSPQTVIESLIFLHLSPSIARG
jgi:hypothetical protein